MINRKTVREALAALLVASGDYIAVYDYPKKNIRGMSPIALVLSGGTQREFVSKDLTITNHYLLVLHLVKRDVDDAIDTLDDLEQSLARLLRNNYQTADWDLIEFTPGKEITVNYAGLVDNDPFIVEPFIIRCKTDEGA